MRIIQGISTFFMVLALVAAPARADDVEEALNLALEAYQAGDLATAKEEIDFAAQLIAQMKAEGLTEFLPEPLEGWEREVEDESTGGMAALGGMMAGARYTSGGDDVTIRMMADNQMVTAMSAMFGNAALMGSMGKVKRIGRQKVVITGDGELQALIDNRIMVQVTGRAPLADKEAYFGAIDFEGLEDF